MLRTIRRTPRVLALAVLMLLACGRARESARAEPAAERPEAAAASVAGPALDCGRATQPVETLVCGDAGLVELDRALGAAWSAALANWSDNLDRVAREKERAWLASRDGCAQAADPRACLAASYRRRLVEVQIEGGQLAAAPPVDYVCAGHEGERFAVVYFAQTETPAAVITFGDRQVIALSEPAASGAKYVAPEFELWDHQGEATVTWSGVSSRCRPRS